MNDNTSVNTTNTNKYVCPICHQEFTDIDFFAKHITQHSEEEKKKKIEEERQRKADQKKIDAAKLEKLRKMYEDAYNTYADAKEKYIEAYHESPNGTFDIFSYLKDFYADGWDHWRH